jgi:hypothetical protein
MGGYPTRPGTIVAGTRAARYEKGDRVWVRPPSGARLPGVIVGHHVDWNLYRVVYMVDVAGQTPRAVEEWRLSPRGIDELP